MVSQIFLPHIEYLLNSFVGNCRGETPGPGQGYDYSWSGIIGNVTFASTYASLPGLTALIHNRIYRVPTVYRT